MRSKRGLERSKHDVERSQQEIQRSKHDLERSKQEIERSKHDVERTVRVDGRTHAVSEEWGRESRLAYLLCGTQDHSKRHSRNA